MFTADYEDFGPSYRPGWQVANMLSATPTTQFGSVAYAGDTNPLTTELVWMSFDVVSTDSRVSIDRAGVMLPYGMNRGEMRTWTFVTESPWSSIAEPSIVLGFEPDPSGQPGETRLGIVDVNPGSFVPFIGEGKLTTAFNYNTGEGGGEVHTDFEVQQRITVNTVVALTAGEFETTKLGALTHTVRVTVVPEPSTGVLAWLLGSLGLSASRRRLAIV